MKKFSDMEIDDVINVIKLYANLLGRLLSAKSRPQLKAEQPALFRLQRYGNLCRHTT